MRWGRVYFGLQAVAGAAWWIGVALSPFVRVTTLGSLDATLVAIADIPLFVVASALAAAGVRTAAWVATAWTALVAIGMLAYATATTEAGWGLLLMAAAAGASVLALALVTLGRIPTEWLLVGPFRFRPARGTRNLASTVRQIIVFWGTFLVVVPLVIAWFERRWGMGIPPPPVVVVVGAVILVLASALGIWSGVTMSIVGRGTPLPSAMPHRLVIAGPYRFMRNPMAVAGLVQGAAVGLVLGSWLVVVYALLGSVLWNYAIRPLEEADLESRFGDQFRAYRTAVRCWVPRWPTRDQRAATSAA